MEQGRRDRNMADKRDRIFRAASDLFDEHGFESVTTRQISDRADVAAGTLFRYASSKGELLLMIYNERFATALDEGIVVAQAASDVVDALLAVVEPILASARIRPEDAAAYQRELIFGAPAERYRAEGLELVARTQAAIVDVLEREASRQGLDPSPAAARLAGRTAFAAVHLAVAAHAASAPTDSADDLRRQLRQIVDGYLIDPSHERNRQ
ncbi:helix-turn-helix domain-containing protein [Gordonia sp. (in: high G+C Gram-positive bacteria)]|uniref:TetR/AcrR family transcriptional regulator n=1 Tax=Gordonia sp. (in: high G+C Gram-positive bacteria) TaxID=84139 RepID=UPI0033424E46